MTKYKIISWNLNGIRSAFKNGFDKYLENSNSDIICIQETKIDDEKLTDDLKKIGNYQSIYYSGDQKGYSGVATFYKRKPVEIITNFGVKEFDTEGRILQTVHEDFILLNVYFPNGKKNDERLDYKMRFNKFIETYCKKLLTKGEKVVICGDVNTAHREIDLANPRPNSKYSGFLPIEREWIDNFLEIGFIDSLRQIEGDKIGLYTWWSLRSKTARERNVGWRIDYFFISSNLKSNLISAKIHKEDQIYKTKMISDHCPISIELEF